MAEFLGPYTTLASFVLTNMLLAASMQIALSSGVFSVATVGFMSMGAYTSALLTQRLDAPFALALLGGVIAALLSTIFLVYPVHRLRGLHLAISTVAFVLVLQVAIRNLPDLTGGANGLYAIPLRTELWQLVVAVVGLGVLLHWMRNSRTGRALRAMREDETVAAAAGVSVGQYRNLAFLLSAALGGLAGGFSAHLLNAISPETFGFERLVQVLTMVVLGGIGSWSGAYLGATVLTLLPEVLRPLADWRDIFNGAVLILVVIYLPGGLVSLGGVVARTNEAHVSPER
jgi:branched-chain amino acid transport system permease protein